MSETMQDLCYILGHEWEIDELMYSTSYEHIGEMIIEGVRRKGVTDGV